MGIFILLMNKRIDDLRHDMDRRFEKLEREVDQKFTELKEEIREIRQLLYKVLGTEIKKE